MKLIKKFFKFFIVLCLICTMLGFSIMVYTGYTLIVPAFEGTGITFTDFFKKEWEDEKIEKLEENLAKRNEIVSNEYVRFVENLIYGIFLPGKDPGDFKMNIEKRTYTDDDINKAIEEADKSFQESLKEYLEGEIPSQ